MLLKKPNEINKEALQQEYKDKFRAYLMDDIEDEIKRGGTSQVFTKDELPDWLITEVRALGYRVKTKKSMGSDIAWLVTWE